jgi:hypothetical protein
MKVRQYNFEDRNTVLEIATKANPNVECSIINNTIFIGDSSYDIDTYITEHMPIPSLN